MPKSMDECVYFTRRSIGSGSVTAWVFREDCPVCKKAKMGKPVEGGKVKVRADFYVCPACAYRVQKKKYEEGLQVHILYVCPACGKKGEVSQPFVRKTFQGVKAIVFSCEACKEKIPITKKLKDVKKK